MVYKKKTLYARITRMALANLSYSKLQTAYEFRTVIGLDRDYLPNVQRVYEFNHHLASNLNRVFTKTVV